MSFRRPQEGETLVAQWKGGAVTAEELDRRFAEMPPAGRARYESETAKGEYVEGLSRFELLAREAIRRGLHRDARVVQATKGALTQVLLEQVAADLSAPSLDDASLRALYEAHRSDFEHPERLRLLLIQVKEKVRAEKLLSQAAKLPQTDFAAFGKLATEQSEDSESRQLSGDLRYLTLDAVATRLGPRVAEAAALLSTPGELSKLVEIPRGFIFVKLQDKQPGLHRPFEQVREELKGRKLAGRAR